MEKLNLDHLPLQKALVESAYNAFVNEENVIAAVLLGSLSSGKGDRVSDADVVVFTKNNFH
ncbi:nucleotidyltransferase domain-containing protein, partial [Vibrio parahaemolyticus]